MSARKSLAALVPLLFACAHAGPARESSLSVPEPPVSSSGAPAAPGSESVTPAPGQPEQNPAAEQPGAPAELVVAAVGDVMLGSTFPEGDPLSLPPEDGAKELAEVTPLLSSADLTFGNLEGPMLEGGASVKCRPNSKSCYAFRVPTRYGKYLRDAGFKVMGLANNHSFDFGQAGRDSSRKVLDALGIGHSGEVGDVARLTVKGRRVAVIAFAPSEGCHDLNDLEAAKKAVSELSASADIVVVSFHGGAEGATRQHVPYGVEEFLGENRGDLRTFTHAMVDAGAALVLGSGPHVVRGMEVYRGRLIAYSLGNFATYGRFNLAGPNGLSLVLEAHLGPDGAFRFGKIHPAKQQKPGGPHLDPSGEIIGKVRALSAEDFGATAVKVEADGVISPPSAQPIGPGA